MSHAGPTGALAAVIAAALLGTSAATPASPAAAQGPMFAAPTFVEAAQGPAEVVAADFNGDGAADLALAFAPGMRAGERPSDEVLLTDGQGGFTRSPLPTRATGLAAGDLDGDGSQDLVATLRNRDRFAVLLGDGRGGFAKPRIAISAGMAPSAVAAGDLDRDGDLDLAVAHAASEDVAVFANDGDAGFALLDRVEMPMPRLDDLIADDLDGDGAAELVGVGRGDLAHPSAVAIARNDGTGDFSKAVRLTDVPSYLHQVGAGDTDADGRPDLVVAARDGLGVRRGDGAARFGDPATIRLPCPLPPGARMVPATYCGPGPIAVDDVDGDGRADVVTTQYHRRAVDVVLAAAAGGFRAPLALPAPEQGAGGPVLIADVDGDCSPDLVTVTFGGVAVYLNTRQLECRDTARATRPLPAPDLDPGRVLAPSFGGPVPVGVPRNATAPQAGDLNGDGAADVLYVSGRSIVARLGGRTGGLSAPRVLWRGRETPRGLALGDADRDGDLDLVTRLGRSIAFLAGDGTGALAAPRRSATTGDSWVAALADLDADGVPDALLRGRADRAEVLTVLRGDATGGFSPVGTTPAGRGLYSEWPSTVALGDLDGDGDTDVALEHGDDGVAVLRNDGRGALAPPVYVRTGTWQTHRGPAGLAVADVDADGRDDLVVTDPARRRVVVLSADGHGGFGAPRAVSTGGAQPSAVVVSDVTGDGVGDLVVTHLESHEFAVLAGDDRGGFAEPTHVVTAGLFPLDLAVADVDGDGASDVVAHNGPSGMLSLHANESPLAQATGGLAGRSGTGPAPHVPST